MARLHFNYGAMNAGKSVRLLQTAFSYGENGFPVICISYENDNRFGDGVIASRVGISRKTDILFNKGTDLFDEIKSIDYTPSVVLIDESQFLSKKQVLQLCRVVDILDITVICYGLRTNYLGEPFEGSIYLLSLADELTELVSVAPCGGRASMNLRTNDSKYEEDIGFSYRSVSRRFFMWYSDSTKNVYGG